MARAHAYPGSDRSSDGVMPLLILSLAVLAAAVVQGSLLAPLNLSYRPNLPLLMAMCGAWLTDSTKGTWLGFWAGLLTATLSGMFVGSFTFSYLVVGWCVGRVREEVYGEWPALMVPVAAVGTLLAEVIFFLWNPRHVWAPLNALSQAGVNAVLGPILYLLFAALIRRTKRGD